MAAVDWAHALLKTNQMIDMIEVLKEMRRRRAHAIQDPTQFLFAHLCVLELLVQVSFSEREEEGLQDGILKKDDPRLKKFATTYATFLQNHIDKCHKKKKKQ